VANMSASAIAHLSNLMVIVRVPSDRSTRNDNKINAN